MWKEYRKKPVVIKAIQWTGENLEEVKELCEFHSHLSYESSDTLVIKTLEGDMKCQKRDYIIIGVNGEYYPCKPDIFEKTYEEV
jgi:hypothetical protein